MMRLFFILSTLIAFLGQPTLASECADGDCHEQELSLEISLGAETSVHQGHHDYPAHHKSEREDCSDHCSNCHQFGPTLALPALPLGFVQFRVGEKISAQLTSFYHPPYLENSLRPPLTA